MDTENSIASPTDSTSSQKVFINYKLLTKPHSPSSLLPDRSKRGEDEIIHVEKKNKTSSRIIESYDTPDKISDDIRDGDILPSTERIPITTETLSLYPMKSPRYISTDLSVTLIHRGHSIPLRYINGSYVFFIKIHEMEIPLECSTVNRTLTISSGDAERYGLRVSSGDYMCCNNDKKYQMYCSDVSVDRRIFDDNLETVTFPRFQFFVNDGYFPSRFGLLQNAGHPGNYSNMRLDRIMFTIRDDELDPQLILGKKAKPQKHALKVDIIRDTISIKNKGLIILPVIDIGIEGDTITPVSGIKIIVPKKDIPSLWLGIVHLQTPTIGLPEPLYGNFMNRFRHNTRLFVENDVEDWEKVSKIIKDLPPINISLYVGSNENKKEPAELVSSNEIPYAIMASGNLKIRIQPEEYIIRSEDGSKCTLAISLIERKGTTKTLIIGSIFFRKKNITVYMDTRKMYFW